MMRKDAKISLICGRRGSGKSTRAKALLSGSRRVVVFDPQGEYPAEGYRRADTLGEVLVALREGWRGGFRVAYVPPAGDEPRALHRLARLLWDAQREYQDGVPRAEQLVLLVEEMDLSYPVRSLPAELDGMPRLVNQGRHAGVNIVGVTQRPASVSATFRGNCAEIYVFPLAWAGDRQAIVQMIGRENEAALRGLRDHHYLLFSNGIVTTGANAAAGVPKKMASR